VGFRKIFKLWLFYRVMLSTIQLSNEVKQRLISLRKSQKQSYEEIILELISLAEIQKRKQKELLIKGYKEMAEEDLKLTQELEGTLMDGLDKNEKWPELEEEI
jgi:predicted CopG family antitoxin